MRVSLMPRSRLIGADQQAQDGPVDERKHVKRRQYNDDVPGVAQAGVGLVRACALR